MTGDREFGEKFEATFGAGERRERAVCVCPSPRIGYRLNKIPICAICNGVIREHEGA